jgi:uncharacterized membrane-anchored protein
VQKRLSPPAPQLETCTLADLVVVVIIIVVVVVILVLIVIIIVAAPQEPHREGKRERTKETDI